MDRVSDEQLVQWSAGTMTPQIRSMARELIALRALIEDMIAHGIIERRSVADQNQVGQAQLNADAPRGTE